jgi:hypothetical protein
MNATTNFLKVAGFAAAFALTTLAASAQQTPPYAEGPPPPPSGPPPAYASNPEPTIRGVVTRIDAKYQIHIRDRAGYIDNVSLHDGTIINPRGIPLQPGMRVVIMGHPEGQAFIANEIDVPNAVGYVPYYYGPGPYYVGFGFGYRRFYGRGWW